MVVNNDLSERELEILKLVATGASNKEIARDLFISTNTVKVHLRNIFSKIGAVSRTEAAMYAVQAGVVAGNNSIEGGFTAPIPTTELPVRWRMILPIGIIVVIILLGFLLVQQTLPVQQTSGSDLSEAEQARWQEKAPMPTARFGLAAAVYENQIYAIGGETDQSVIGAVERYDPQTDAWEILSPKPVPVSDISAALIGGLIYVPGGRLASGMVTDKLEIYDPLDDTWKEGAPLPVPLSAYALAAFEGKLYLFGGWDGEKFIPNVYQYQPDQDDWEELTPMPAPRGYAGAEVIGSKIFIFGGFDGVKVLSDGQVFSPNVPRGDVEAWDTGIPALVARYGMGVAEIADIVYVVGGKGEIGEGQEAVAYFYQSNEWRSIPTPTFELGAQPQLVNIGNFLYLIGGNLNSLPSDRNNSYQAVYTVSVPLIVK